MAQAKKGTVQSAAVTIEDVAVTAGVSKATVSRVMNRPYLVQEDTIQKVRKAMLRLRYTPNTVAQSMRSLKTKTIGVLIPDLKNPFYSGMLCEIERDLRKWDYMMMICPTSGFIDEEREYVSRMMQRRIDGILHFTYNNSKAHIDQIMKITKDVPFILMDESSDNLHVNQVVTDGYSGVMEAVDYLVKEGHTKIACACSKTKSGSRRLEGYLDAMKKHGLPVPDGFVQPSGFTVEDGADAARRFLALRDRPAVIICVADSIAVGLMNTLIAAGVRVPGQIEVIGFNNSELSTIVSPGLSTIGQNMPELSEQAVRMLMELIESGNKNKNANIVKVKAELVLRGSTRQ